MSYSFRQDLFEVDGGALCFDVSKCHDAEELKLIIEHGGGRTDKRGGQYTISFRTRNSPSDTNFNPPRDLYCSDFILKCCVMNTILSLKKFLLKESIFISEFDPNDILLRKLTWKDAQSLYACRNVTESKTFKSPPGCVKIDGMVPVVKLEIMDGTAENNYSFARHEFTPNDRQQIVDFIVSNPDFDLSKQDFWRKMAEGFSVHTWQSLKNHFRNKIHPSLEEYKLSNELVDKIKNQMKGSQRSSKTRKTTKGNENLKRDSDSDSELSSQPKKRQCKSIVILDEESSDDSSVEIKESSDDPLVEIKESSDDSLGEINEQDSLQERAMLDQNGTCQPDDLSENVNQDQDESSKQSSVLLTNIIEEIPPQEEEHETESSHCDFDEATVTDNFVQTEPVEILPLPKGWDYHLTFAGAIEMITKKEDNAAKEVNSPKTKPTPSKAVATRRSPRKLTVKEPKKTRSGSAF